MKVRVYQIIKQTKVEGPETRYCIWFQGCSRHCKGCWAEATWPHDGGQELEAEEILNDILATPNIQGVTFLGGEPFEQPEALEFLARSAKEAGLSVLCFTGGKIEDIKNREILNYIDLLIDGEFREAEKDFSRPWVGSKNQRYHFLTDRYDEKILTEYKNKIEVNIQKNGLIFINGMGDFDKLAKNLDMITRH
ncbi:MAG: radical SAM protein [Fusobacterium sp.]|nr:radical SAM protein [Fusobacterium sp.]